MASLYIYSLSDHRLIKKQLVQLIVWATLCSGCDYINKPISPTETNAPAEQPAPAEPIVVEPPRILKVGQSTAEVCELLGPPLGVMTSSNQTIYIYEGEPLRFVDDQLTSFVPNFYARIMAKKRLALIAEQEAKIEPSCWKVMANKIRALAHAIEHKNTDLSDHLIVFFQKHFAIKKDSVDHPVTQVTLLDKKKHEIHHDALVVLGKITVVDFYTSWSDPCNTMTPILEDFIRVQPDVVLRKINIGRWGSDITLQYDITSVPDVRVFDKKGRLVALPTSVPNDVLRAISVARNNE